MSNAIIISKMVKGSDKHCAIICHNLFYCSQSAQDIFEDEGSKGAYSFDMEGMLPWPCNKETPGLNDVIEASS